MQIRISLKGIRVASFLIIMLNYSVENCTAQTSRQNANEVTYKGNKFKLQSHGLKDTMKVSDPISGKEKKIVVEVPPQPITMNGQKIYNIDGVTTPPQNYTINLPLEEYLLTKLIDDIDLKLSPNGFLSITLNNVIIDTNGHVVYYHYNGITFTGQDKQRRSVNEDSAKVDVIMANAPIMKPAILNGIKVVTRLDISLAKYKVEVNDHTATYYIWRPGQK